MSYDVLQVLLTRHSVAREQHSTAFDRGLHAPIHSTHTALNYPSLVSRVGASSGAPLGCCQCLSKGDASGKSASNASHIEHQTSARIVGAACLRLRDEIRSPSERRSRCVTVAAPRGTHYAK